MSQSLGCKNEKAIGRGAESGRINNLLDSTKAAIYKVYREIQERDNYVTAEKVKNAFLGLDQKQQSLLELFDYHNRKRKSQVGVTLCKSTYYRYLRTRTLLAEFLSQEYNLTDIAVKELTRSFIGSFEAFLLARRLSKNTVVALMKKLRHIIELALEREWIQKNPFKEHKLRWQQTVKGYLTQEEIDKLSGFQLPNKALEESRDVFTFCTFTGLSYSDVKHLTSNNIQSSFDGKLWIRGKRRKTDRGFENNLFPISGHSAEIIQKNPKSNIQFRIFNLTIHPYSTEYNESHQRESSFNHLVNHAKIE